MASVNKAIIVGNLGRDPELRHTNGGTPVANLSVATTYKPKEGEEQTEWHRVTVWGKQAESCDKYLAKGRSVYIEGRLQTRKYEADGVTKYSTEIVADRVQFLGGKPREEDKPADYDPGAFSSPAGQDEIPF